jgi:hypothetical protein
VIPLHETIRSLGMFNSFQFILPDQIHEIY